MKNKKILLVDDVKFFLDLEKSFLKRTHCEILLAGNGKEALSAIRNGRPDLVLMDLYMPEMNGDECCRLVKSDPSLKDIRVIMVTTAGKQEEKERCLSAGCDGYVTKPINKLELLDKVREYLDVAVRAHVRAPIDVKVTYYANERKFINRISDVSEGGLFIETSELQQEGTGLKILFRLPDSNRLIEATCIVRRVVTGPTTHPAKMIPGMGVQFAEISAEDVVKISKYVGSGNYLI